MLKKATGIRNQQTARAGEFFVAAELNRRGANAVTFAGNMPGIDILANMKDKVVQIQVKSKRKGTWQTSYKEGRQNPRPNDNRFWVFVDLKRAAPEYYIVPDHWIRKNIYKRFLQRGAAFLQTHRGTFCHFLNCKGQNLIWQKVSN